MHVSQSNSSPLVLVAGLPSAESDRALARAFTALLERKHTGTRWRVERVEARRAPEAPAREVPRCGARGVGDHDEAVVVAA
jgi:hypothetical protein